jgi:hypothetical protein
MTLAFAFAKVSRTQIEATETDCVPVNGHIESRCNVRTGEWTEPEFVEDPFLRIHGMAPGLNYGTPKTPFSNNAH